MTIKIYFAGADIADGEAMRAFTAPLEDGDEVRGMLESGFTGRTQRHDEKTQKAFYLVSDGKHAECYTIEGITLRQAAEVAAACDAIQEWNSSAFREAARTVLGDVDLLH